MIEHPCGALAVSATGGGPVRVPFRLCCVAALFATSAGQAPPQCLLARTTARPGAGSVEQRDDLGRAA
ncbi:hypothetical protein [Symbioplanes lichenis]|uniref:hypothetical protein n=1 Tax=Symbioplanes lichenis TaxID=1629072 RepID=UPI0027382964|nr:hypothetical protein [Actinoplanes lichenis]